MDNETMYRLENALVPRPADSKAAVDELHVLRSTVLSERALADLLYDALKTCRPWIDDFGQGDDALRAYEEARRD